jgi:hypothetical protein
MACALDTYQGFYEGFTEAIQDVELRESDVVVEEGGEKKNVFSAKSIFGVESACRQIKFRAQSNTSQTNTVSIPCSIKQIMVCAFTIVG